MYLLRVMAAACHRVRNWPRRPYVHSGTARSHSEPTPSQLSSLVMDDCGGNLNLAPGAEPATRGTDREGPTLIIGRRAWNGTSHNVVEGSTANESGVAPSGVPAALMPRGPIQSSVTYHLARRIFVG
jgi:hypothetical protein